MVTCYSWLFSESDNEASANEEAEAEEEQVNKLTTIIETANKEECSDSLDTNSKATKDVGNSNEDSPSWPCAQIVDLNGTPSFC